MLCRGVCLECLERRLWLKIRITSRSKSSKYFTNSNPRLISKPQLHPELRSFKHFTNMTIPPIDKNRLLNLICLHFQSIILQALKCSSKWIYQIRYDITICPLLLMKFFPNKWVRIVLEIWPTLTQLNLTLGKFLEMRDCFQTKCLIIQLIL